MGIQLSHQSSHVVHQLTYFVIETIYLCGIADDGTEGIQIVVELPLQVGGGFHFLLGPDMAGGLQQHHLLLILQFFLRLVGVHQNHPRKSRVVLRPHSCKR